MLGAGGGRKEERKETRKSGKKTERLRETGSEKYRDRGQIELVPIVRVPGRTGSSQGTKRPNSSR